MKLTLLAMLVFASGFTIFLFGHNGTAQEMGMENLLKQLEIPGVSQSAVDTIVAKGTHSEDDRSVVANALPAMMDRAVDGTVVSNEMLIAGDLQVTACIPELMKYYIKGDAGVFITWSRVERLANDPADLALSKIEGWSSRKCSDFSAQLT